MKFFWFVLMDKLFNCLKQFCIGNATSSRRWCGELDHRRVCLPNCKRDDNAKNPLFETETAQLRETPNPSFVSRIRLMWDSFIGFSSFSATLLDWKEKMMTKETRKAVMIVTTGCVINNNMTSAAFGWNNSCSGVYYNCLFISNIIWLDERISLFGNKLLSAYTSHQFKQFQ